MKRIFSSIVCVGIIFSSVFINPKETQAYYTYMPASVVLGQTDFVSQTCGTAADKFSCTGDTGIRGIFVAPNGRLIVSDTANNRVLIWNQIPTTNGQSADVVIGQADFVSGSANRGGSADASTLSTPVALWSDGTKLIVGDTNNNRALVWNSFPTSNGQSADVVIGQTTMSDTSTSCDADHVGNVYGIAVYNGKLVMANQNYNRVLIYNSIPTSNGASADTVLGQTGMATCTSGTISASTFSSPRGVTVDGNGKLVVADRSRHRILIWNSFPTSNGTAADTVLGQSSFTTSSNALTQSGLNSPAVVYTTGGRLFISDTQNARVLVYNSILSSNGQNADIVIGTPSFTSDTDSCDVSPSCFDNTSSPIGMFVYDNKLIVGDGQASRVLIFNNVVSNPFLNIKSPLTSLGEGRLRVVGDVVLGERGTYSLQKVLVDVNGQGYGNVSYLSGGRDGGSNNTLYDFFHDFEPWAGSNGDSSLWKSDVASMTDSRGYTLKVKASSFNADEMVLFYFLPFKLTSFTNLTYSAIPKSDLNLIIPSTISTYLTSSSFHKITFKVNKYQIQRLKDNIDHFEVEVRKTNTATLSSLTSDLTNPWTKYGSDIPTSLINTDENSLSKGEITTYIPNTLTKTSSYEVRIVSVSKESAWRQYSNTLTLSPTTKVTTTLTSYPTTTGEEPTQLPQETPLPTLEPLPTTTPDLTQTNNNFTFQGLMIGLGVLIPLVVLGVLVVRRKLTKS